MSYKHSGRPWEWRDKGLSLERFFHDRPTSGETRVARWGATNAATGAPLAARTAVGAGGRWELGDHVAGPGLRHTSRDHDGAVALRCCVLSSAGAPARRQVVLAQELHADLLWMDDWEGRREAERRALRVPGMLGALEHAAERGLLDLPAALARLQATNFCLPTTLIRDLLARDAARRRHA